MATKAHTPKQAPVSAATILGASATPAAVAQLATVLAASKPTAPAPAAVFSALVVNTTPQAQQPASVPAVPVLVPATYASLPFAQLTKTQQGFATAKHAPTMPKVPGALTMVGAKAYKVRSGNNAAWWCAMQSAGCASASGASPQALASAVQAGALCPKFLGYAVARGWVVAVA